MAAGRWPTRVARCAVALAAAQKAAPAAAAAAALPAAVAILMHEENLDATTAASQTAATRLVEGWIDWILSVLRTKTIALAKRP